MKDGEAVASQDVFCSIHTYSISKRHDSNVPAACAQHSNSDLGRLPMRTGHKQHFCRSAGAFSFSAAAT
eukprot:3535068-Prymnesium_polylepis.1